MCSTKFISRSTYLILTEPLLGKPVEDVNTILVADSDIAADNVEDTPEDTPTIFTLFVLWLHFDWFSVDLPLLLVY